VGEGVRWQKSLAVFLRLTLGSFKVTIIDPIIGSIIFTIMSFLEPIFD